MILYCFITHNNQITQSQQVPLIPLFCTVACKVDLKITTNELIFLLFIYYYQ